MTKRRPTKFNLLAAFLCIVGVGFISLNGDAGVNIGDVLTLGCAVFYAIHIVLVSKFSPGRNIFVLTMWQFFFVAVLSAVVAGLVVMAGSMLCMVEPQTYLTEIYDVNATNDFVFRLILPYLFLMTTMLAVAFPRLPRRWVFTIMAGFSFRIVMLNFASDIFN